MEKVHRLSRAQGISMAAAALTICDTDELPTRARSTLLELMRNFGRWRELASVTDHAELTRIVLDECGYTTMLQADRSTEAAGRLENLTELARAMEEYETLGDFLEHVSLVMTHATTRPRSRY